MLTNLVDNAIKFTELGEVRLVLRATGAASDPRLLECDVIDTGPGMTSDECAAVFETFYQGDASMTRGSGGVGLGLAIALQISRRLGGDLEVESRPGHGSCFRFRFDPGELDGSAGSVALARPRASLGSRP